MVRTSDDGLPSDRDEAPIAPSVTTNAAWRADRVAERVLRAVWAAFIDGTALHGAAVCGRLDHHRTGSMSIAPGSVRTNYGLAVEQPPAPILGPSRNSMRSCHRRSAIPCNDEME